jgi:hypothetical protein
MALSVFFLLSAVLVFINIEPFTMAGIFLSLCYLPGLCFFTLFRRDKLEFEDLILAFPCSVGISSILILGLLLSGIHIKHIPIIILTINGIAVFLYIIDSKKNAVYTAIVVRRQELLFSLFALSIILLLSIPFFLGPNRVGISGHAFHHSVMVSQIMNGIFPPENPGLGGTSIGYYWGFHALIAALTVKSNVQQIQTMFMLNLIALYFIFCISYCFAKAFNLSEIYCYILPLAVMGLMRSDAGILFLVKLFTGKLVSFEKITASPIEPLTVLQNYISGLSWIDTRLFFLRKLYNISGMLLAVNLCYAYLLLLVRILKTDYQINRMDIICIALIISACFFNYPPLAIFLLLHVPLWTCYIFLSTRGNLKEKIMEAMRIALPFIAAVLVVSPYLRYVMVSRDISSGSQGGIFSFDFYDQSLKNMVVFLIPLPVIIYGAWTALKKLSFSREFYFLSISTALCLTLTIFTRWPFDNSYKFNYILLLFFALFFVFAVSRLLAFIGNSWLKRLITILIIFFLLLPTILVEATHIISAFSTDHIYAFPGKHITFAQDNQKNEAYMWIRENTPGNALLMLSYVESNLPCCAFNNNYEPAAVAERALYVIKDEDYTISNPEYAKRVEIREKLFATPEDPQVIDFFNSLNRPVYLLVEDKMEEDRFFVENRFKHLPVNLGKRFVPVFQNDRQWVYLVSVNK